jgi:hypothetical protein
LLIVNRAGYAMDEGVIANDRALSRPSFSRINHRQREGPISGNSADRRQSGFRGSYKRMITPTILPSGTNTHTASAWEWMNSKATSASSMAAVSLLQFHTGITLMINCTSR